MSRPLEELVAELRSGDEATMREAVYLLGARGHRSVTPAMLEALRAARARADVETTALLCRALGRLRDGRGFPALLAIVGSGEWVAVWAIEAVGTFRREEAIPVLQAALARPMLRRAALRALGKLGSPGTLRGHVTYWSPERRFGFVRDQTRCRRFFSAREWDADAPPARGTVVTFYPSAMEQRPIAVRVRPKGRRPDPRREVGAVPEPAGGTVRWYDRNKGVGFIRQDGDGRDVLAHASELDGPQGWSPRARARVRFDVIETPLGRRALGIRPEPEPEP